ncbi:MAG: Hsp20/alpha crystallin family protein, partial [Calditerricola sp.]|nr:Hsp20/alpha crystallin family protein [Calditerricola sp.]
MALLPYEPFRQIDDWRRGLVRLFDEGFWREMFTSVGPRVDVYETADAVVVQCELPGLAQQDDVS